MKIDDDGSPYSCSRRDLTALPPCPNRTIRVFMGTTETLAHLRGFLGP